MVHVRVDEETKDQATQTLAALGMSVSDAVRLFLKRVVIEQALPLHLDVPNDETQAALRRAMKMNKLRYSNGEELFNVIKENIEREKGKPTKKI